MAGKRFTLWAALLLLVPSVGCCRWCERWCHDNHPYYPAAHGCCTPPTCCPAGYTPVCCPAPAGYGAPAASGYATPAAGWQRPAQDCCR